MPKWAKWYTCVVPIPVVGLVVFFSVRDHTVPESVQQLFVILLGATIFVVGIVGASCVAMHINRGITAGQTHIRSAFSLLAARTGLRLNLASTEVKGVYRENYRAFFSVEPSFDGSGTSCVSLLVRPRSGYWPKDTNLCRRKPPAWLSSTGRDILRRLCDKGRRPSRIETLKVTPRALECDVHNMTEVFADPADLHAVLDELILLADTLPLARSRPSGAKS